MPWTSTPSCSASWAWGVSTTWQPTRSPMLAPVPRNLTFFKSILLAACPCAFSQPPWKFSPPELAAFTNASPLLVSALAGKEVPSMKVSGCEQPSTCSRTNSNPAPSMPAGNLTVSMPAVASATTGVNDEAAACDCTGGGAGDAAVAEATVSASTVTAAAAADAAADGGGVAGAARFAGATASGSWVPSSTASTICCPAQRPATPWSKAHPLPSATLRYPRPPGLVAGETSSASNSSPATSVAPVTSAFTSGALRSRIFVRARYFPGGRAAAETRCRSLGALAEPPEPARSPVAAGLRSRRLAGDA
mmetsp:Transcript_24228/g.43336  ORF Transcript_24228/g.43336 Transcript_24228/m.43336 type:complete len:306 (+) Transcript_24228:747-1664(+)